MFCLLMRQLKKQLRLEIFFFFFFPSFLVFEGVFSRKIPEQTQEVILRYSVLVLYPSHPDAMFNKLNICTFGENRIWNWQMKIYPVHVLLLRTSGFRFFYFFIFWY